MGHYASEIDPSWQENIDRTTREINLRESLKDIPLGYFKAGDLAPLMKLTGLLNMVHDPLSRDLEHLEKRVEEIKAGNVPFSPQVEE